MEPCQECLSGNNNGHYFMFGSPYLNAQHRMGEPYLAWFGSWSLEEMMTRIEGPLNLFRRKRFPRKKILAANNFFEKPETIR